jgi:two-component system sensor histidine kinase ChvG
MPARRLLRLISRSLAGKIVVLAVVFLVVPIILYSKFAEVDAERQAFLLRNLQIEGRLVAEDLEPILTRAGARAPLDAGKAVQDLANGQVHVKLLLRPQERSDSFFLVAANPPLETAELDMERQRLVDTGILAKLDESCAGEQPLAIHYAGGSGKEELLTSISTFHNGSGCWAIVTSYALQDLAGSSLARPFSEAPEVRLAMALYGLLAFLAFLAVAGALLDIRAFAKLARRIRLAGPGGEQTFAKTAAVPELVPVAREFDRMVATLEASARGLREAAEDNAHALKAPIGAITQSLEPLRLVAQPDDRATHALSVIERALSRLTALISAARRLDETTASLIDSGLQPIDLAALARDMGAAFDRIHSSEGVSVTVTAPASALVLATTESLETAIENLLDNAISFSPANGTVTLSVRRHGRHVFLAVEDEGPGVPNDRLETIFRRNVSMRPATPQPALLADGTGNAPPEHFGIGLSVVRRTVQLLGGEVRAENIPGAGLRVVLSFPSA